MALVNRWYQILQLFVSHRNLSIDELKIATHTSAQTIKKSIELLNEQIIGIAEIVQEENRYCLIIHNFEAFDKVLTGSLKEKTDFNSSSKRVAYIVKELLVAKKYLLIDDLAENLEVSRGTVNKDLRTIKSLMEDFNVKLEGTPNRGLRINGTEFDLRLLYLQHVYDYFPLEILTPKVLLFVEKLIKKFHIEKSISFDRPTNS
ncbi:transcriptional antiterminator [Enterococcus sp. PF1-24]|uniref:HTH domain-containing protein n=1 Tax=unclassified Enterococcus TaxID=2608891 RepID=UPI002475B20C|nr:MULTISPECIES: HTH domain-containing protein [unclassified Enterococcus]MDH6363242.1 transcriptional antiterminator [Enterococcus sp. PFB1-1]MDH6400457.1 transcriptional antiterminator [Enterococcus sp. PF1-24]